jgi:hypothetical protein
MVYAVNKLPADWQRRISEKAESLYGVVQQHRDWEKARKAAAAQGEEPPTPKEWKTHLKEAEKRAKEEAVQGEAGPKEGGNGEATESTKPATEKKCQVVMEDKKTGLVLGKTKRKAPEPQEIIAVLGRWIAELRVAAAKGMPTTQQAE